MLRTTLAAFLVVLLSLSSCANRNERYTGWFKDLKGCHEEYAAMDARVDAAGVRDAAYYRVPGFPYLRTDRLMASFRNQITSVDEVGGWLRRMREMDQEAREFEYINLGMSLQEQAIQRDRFLNCGRGLAGLELTDNPATYKRLLESVPPPDEYSQAARTLGLYPLAVPILRSRIAAEHARVKQEFSKPLAQLDAGGELMLWKVKPLKEPELLIKNFESAFIDELGFPGLVDSQWQALAEHYAPQLWIETRNDQDRPGTPVWTHDGVSADPAQPLVNYTISFARFGTWPVVQLTYFTWFKGAGKEHPLDGIMWRVTLDLYAKPLAYESLHTSGRAHYWFPVQALERRPAASYWEEPALLPQEQVPAESVALRLQSGTHALRRVLAADEASASSTHTYELRRYEDLYTLPLPEGGSRSLFGPDGRVPGTGGSDPNWLWASGVQAPGALRQYGHHATTYVGRQQFDEPFLLQSVFVAPQHPPAVETTRQEPAIPALQLAKAVAQGD